VKLFFSLSLLLFFSSFGWAQEAVPGPLVYDILREGQRIGQQTIAFEKQDNKLMVHTQSDLVVTVLGVPVYRFRQKMEETWVDDKLQSLQSSALDDGTQKDLSLIRVGNILTGTYNGQPKSLDGSLLPSTLWHPDSPKASRILDVVSGRSRVTMVQNVGQDMVSIAGRNIPAMHFRFSGQFKRDAWYDEKKRLVKAVLTAKDGSEVTEQLAKLSD
jgi:hypothetical protein